MNHEIRMALIRTLPFLVVIFVVAILIKQNKIIVSVVDIRKPFSCKSYLIWIFGFLIYSVLIEFSLYSFNILEVNTGVIAYPRQLF